MVKIGATGSRLLITGAGGFVGRALTPALDRAGRDWIAATRRHDPTLAGRQIVIGNIDADTSWRQVLDGVDLVVHLAARTHELHDRDTDPLDTYRRINLYGTSTLARQAAAAGVRRLIFLSSIKVNGEQTPEHAFTANDPPRPEDAYGLTKREAEDELRRVAAETGLEIVVLRPPLVYGPGVKGNFLRLLRLVALGLPLPLASVNNRRSLVFVGNLVEAMLACLDAPAAAGKTYLVSDGEDLSTPELVRRIARAMQRPVHLWPCPPRLLALAGTILGKQAEIRRLTGSLQIDGKGLCEDLGWQPRYSLDQGLYETVRWYHRNQH